VSPGGQQLGGQGGHPISQEDRSQRGLKLFRQTLSFSQQFRSHGCQDPAPLLGEDPDPIRRRLGPGSGAGRERQRQGLNRAYLHASAAEIAAFTNDQGLGRKVQDPEGADLDALAAGDTFLRVKDEAHIKFRVVGATVAQASSL